MSAAANPATARRSRPAAASSSPRHVLTAAESRSARGSDHRIRLRAIRLREDAPLARRAPRATLAWVVLRGRAEVTAGPKVAQVGRHGLVAAAPGEAVTLVARGGELRLLEFEAAPRQR